MLPTPGLRLARRPNRPAARNLHRIQRGIVRTGIWRRRLQIVPVAHIQYHPRLSADSRRQIERCLGEAAALGANPLIVSESFRTLELDRDELLACCQFTPEAYVRVELASCEAWVLLALAWDNCATAIHDHDNSECGFRIIAGTLIETRFARTPAGDARQVAKRELTEGMVVSSHCEAIHRLATLPGQQAVSLHAYSPRLAPEDMHVFDEAN